MIPPPNVNPSSGDGEINLDDLLKLAEDADRFALEDEPEPKRRRKKKAEEPEEPETIGDDGEPMEPMDPEWGIMWVSLTGEGVQQMVDHFDWTDPGIHWKEKVGQALARISHRLTGLGQGKYTDIGIVVGYVGLWVGSNAAIGKTKSPGLIGNDGKREDIQTPPNPIS